MKKISTAEMRIFNGGAYKCSLCNKIIWTYAGCGVHHLAKHKKSGKKHYCFKIW